MGKSFVFPFLSIQIQICARAISFPILNSVVNHPGRSNILHEYLHFYTFPNYVLQVYNVSKFCFLTQFGLHRISQGVWDFFLPPDSFKSYFADFDDFEPIFSLAQNRISVKMKVYFSGNDFLFWFRFQFMVFDKE